MVGDSAPISGLEDIDSNDAFGRGGVQIDHVIRAMAGDRILASLR